MLIRIAQMKPIQKTVALYVHAKKSSPFKNLPKSVRDVLYVILRLVPHMNKFYPA